MLNAINANIFFKEINLGLRSPSTPPHKKNYNDHLLYSCSVLTNIKLGIYS